MYTYKGNVMAIHQKIESANEYFIQIDLEKAILSLKHRKTARLDDASIYFLKNLDPLVLNQLFSIGWTNATIPKS